MRLTSVAGFTTARKMGFSAILWLLSRSINAPPHSSLFICRKKSWPGCKTSANVTRVACFRPSTSTTGVDSEDEGIAKGTIRVFSPMLTSTSLAIFQSAKRSTILNENRNKDRGAIINAEFSSTPRLLAWRKGSKISELHLVNSIKTLSNTSVTYSEVDAKEVLNFGLLLSVPRKYSPAPGTVDNTRNATKYNLLRSPDYNCIHPFWAPLRGAVLVTRMNADCPSQSTPQHCSYAWSCGILGLNSFGDIFSNYQCSQGKRLRRKKKKKGNYCFKAGTRNNMPINQTVN